MTAYVFDTNTVSLILRRDPNVLTHLYAKITRDDLIPGCPVVWYELRRGFLATGATAQMERFEALFATFVWQDYALADWSLAATLWAQRRTKGMPIGDADLLIGVYARNRDAVLVTDNEKDFVGLSVKVENWKRT